MTKKTPHTNISAEELFKYSVLFVEKYVYLMTSVFPSMIREIKKIAPNVDKFIYWEGEISECPLCGGEVKKNGTPGRLLNKNEKIYLQRYKCKTPGCKYDHVTNIDHIVPKCSNYETELRYEPIKQQEIGYLSLEKNSEMIESKYHAKPTRSTILNLLDNEGEKHLKKCEESMKYDDSELSGVFAIDEQFPRVNGKEKARIVLMDPHTNIIIDEMTVPSEKLNIDVKRKFITKNLKDKVVKGIVSDSDKAYLTIFEENGYLHQRCNFHLMQNLMDDLIKPINRLKRQIKSKNRKIEEIQIKLPSFKYKKSRKNNEKKLKKLRSEIRQHKKELKELLSYKERISNIFKQEDPKKAKMRFQILYNNRDNLPPAVATFIKRLAKNFDKAINHMRYDFLPRTNNQLECYNGVSLPDNQKRKYRTDRGLNRAITLGRKRWMDRNRKKLTA